MAKNIIFCADGTWNGPGQDDDHDRVADPTNVFKLFANLDGVDAPETTRLADEQERRLATPNGTVRQVAKYLHGVGDSDNFLVRMGGGAGGAGLVTRVVRGYTFISRNYAAGDRILRLERQTGKQKSEVPLKERVRDLEFTDASIMVITEDQTKQKSITHISLPSGAGKTEVLTGLPPTRVAPGRLPARLAPQPRGSGADEGPGAGDMGDFLPSAKEFQPAGANVAQFKSTLLEKRLVAVQAMKAAPRIRQSHGARQHEGRGGDAQ